MTTYYGTPGSYGGYSTFGTNGTPTLEGKKKIRWIGKRSYSHARGTAQREVWPVRIERGALGDGLPRRDLWVSPEHALFIDGMLIPASALANDVSIRREEFGPGARLQSVSYFHLEFDAHAVIYAEGAFAESFVDDYSRGMFDNAAQYQELYPHAIPRPARFCAPRVADGEELQRVRQRLLARITRLGGQTAAHLLPQAPRSSRVRFASSPGP